MIVTRPSEKETQREEKENRDKSANDTLAIRINGLTALFTGLAFLTALGQVFLFYKQLRYMRENLRDAKTAADAAKSSADVAREALEKLERAIVVPTRVTYYWHGDTDRPGKFWWSFHPAVKNAGRTHTVDMRMSFNSVLRDSPIPEDFEFSYLTPPRPLNLGPEMLAEWGGHGISATDETLIAIREGKKFYYFWAEFSYKDVFSQQRHLTRVCYQIGAVLGDPASPLEPHTISFAIHEQYNETS
ncbi:hypothetical protein EEB15_22590 [Ramlibacter sp. WS9]|nr:hypothetical protein EEB15_22590 [Ramlibacter sp. WS9]